jgi:hypothetical protein
MHITDSEDHVTIVRIPMHVPTESNSVYKKRLITAMLDEPVFSETRRPTPKLIPGWSPTLVAAAVGIALFSALGVFLFLYHNDASANSSAAATTVRGGNGVVGPSAPGHLAAVQQHTAKAAVSPAASSASAGGNVSAAAPVEFKLKRSRTYQKIGTIGLRLVRVNTRRRTCDLSVQLSDRRVVQKRLLLNKPLQLKSPTSTEPLQLSISGIGRDSVAGALSLLASSADATKQASIQ